MTTRRTFETRQKIIVAAVRRFERADIRQMTMIEIASEAGVSRATIYRLFKDWEALLEAVLTHRFFEVVDAMRSKFKSYRSLRDALVEGPVFGIRLLRRDRFSGRIVASMNQFGVGDIILIANPQIRELFQALWEPTFARARASGELQSHLSNERLIEGVRCVCGFLTMRPDLDEEGQREHLRDFLVPAILGSDAP